MSSNTHTHTNTQNTKRQFQVFLQPQCTASLSEEPGAPSQPLWTIFQEENFGNWFVDCEIRESFLFGVMGVVVCVCSCCPDPAGGRSAACSHWIRHHLLSFCIGCTHTHTSAWQLVCTLTYTHAWKLRPQSDCKVKLVDQQHPPLYLILSSIFPYPSLAVWASHLSALGLSSLPFLFSLPFLCRCSRSLLPISLSSSPPLLFRLSSPDGSTRDLLAWPSAVALMLFPVSPAARLVWLLHQCKEKLQLQ